MTSMASKGPKWEFCDDAQTVERFPVPGGWLYRTCSWVELPSAPDEPTRGYWQWSGPVPVAELLTPAMAAARASVYCIVHEARAAGVPSRFSYFRTGSGWVEDFRNATWFADPRAAEQCLSTAAAAAERCGLAPVALDVRAFFPGGDPADRR